MRAPPFSLFTSIFSLLRFCARVRSSPWPKPGRYLSWARTMRRFFVKVRRRRCWLVPDIMWGSRCVPPARSCDRAFSICTVALADIYLGPGLTAQFSRGCSGSFVVFPRYRSKIRCLKYGVIAAGAFVVVRT